MNIKISLNIQVIYECSSSILEIYLNKKKAILHYAIIPVLVWDTYYQNVNINLFFTDSRYSGKGLNNPFQIRNQ